jgi:hypothetical protein
MPTDVMGWPEGWPDGGGADGGTYPTPGTLPVGAGPHPTFCGCDPGSADADGVHVPVLKGVVEIAKVCGSVILIWPETLPVYVSTDQLTRDHGEFGSNVPSDRMRATSPLSLTQTFGYFTRSRGYQLPAPLEGMGNAPGAGW